MNDIVEKVATKGKRVQHGDKVTRGSEMTSHGKIVKKTKVGDPLLKSKEKALGESTPPLKVWKKYRILYGLTAESMNKMVVLGHSTDHAKGKAEELIPTNHQVYHIQAVDHKRDNIDEAMAFKVGDIVTPLIGPHAGADHRVIHVHKDDTYNITPTDLKANKIKYHLGAVRASLETLVKAKKKEVKPGFKLKEETELDEATNLSLECPSCGRTVHANPDNKSLKVGNTVKMRCKGCQKNTNHKITKLAEETELDETLRYSHIPKRSAGKEVKPRDIDTPAGTSDQWRSDAYRAKPAGQTTVHSHPLFTFNGKSIEHPQPGHYVVRNDSLHHNNDHVVSGPHKSWEHAHRDRSSLAMPEVGHIIHWSPKGVKEDLDVTEAKYDTPKTPEFDHNFVADKLGFQGGEQLSKLLAASRKVAQDKILKKTKTKK